MTTRVLARSLDSSSPSVSEGLVPPVTRQVAATFLTEDEHQLEYYEALTNRTPGSVLRRRGIVHFT